MSVLVNTLPTPLRIAPEQAHEAFGRTGFQEEDLRNRALCIIAAKQEELAIFRDRFGLIKQIAGATIPGSAIFTNSG